MVDFHKLNYEKKLAQLGQKYETMKREADTKKGALLNTVDNMKAEHGIETADEAKAMIKDLKAKVHSWEIERDELVEKIEAAINGGGRREDGPLKADDDGFEVDDDEFDEFEDN